jgi:hypothetical protein
MVSIAKMREQLLEGFPEPQADLMARVFVSAQDELVTKAELNELTAVVRDLAEIQRRTDEKLGSLAQSQRELAEAQRRTDEKMGSLAEAQRRTEEKLGSLAESQRDLVEAQRRTDEKVGSLAEAQRDLSEAQRRTEWAVKDLAKQVGGLSAALGGSLEDFACDLVPELLEKHWAMVVESAAPEDVTVGDGPREFDIVVRGRIDGRPLAVICEAKATVSVKEVKRFLTLVGRLRDARPADDIRPLFFGYKADRTARELIVASGAAMVFTRGVMIPLPPG